MQLDALVAPLRADVVSGASVVARTAAEVVRRAAVRVEADSGEAFRERMAELAVRILHAQPAMAPLVALGSQVLRSLPADGPVQEARRAAARAAEEFRTSLERSTREVGEVAAGLLPERGTVLTLSSSSMVRAALTARAGDGGLRVVCLEGRPVNEGRMLAEALAREGLPVLYAVDAAAASLLDRASLVLLGADSVGDRGVVNKIGSAAVVRLARDRGIPVVVTAGRAKLLPPGFPQPVEDDRPGEEVWRPPPGIRVWNRYFEVLPMASIHRLVTEEGAFSPEETEGLRGGLEVPPELRRWARARTG